jgi:hypothetical protein
MYIWNIIMFVAEIPTRTSKGKISHICILLRHSYREGGKPKSKTIANSYPLSSGRD